MPWVRFDDQFPIHRKVRGLSDPAYRLHSEAIFWCARNLTDGFVPAADLLDVASARRPLKFVPELVVRRNWHLADEACDSKKCPAHVDNRPELSGDDGWIIHDYFEYQPTKARVLEDRAKNAERQKRFRDGQRDDELERDSERNGVTNGVTNGRSNTTPSRPVPSRRDGGSSGADVKGDQSVRVGARAREATRWLIEQYRLTSAEAAETWVEAERRATDPIKYPIPYLKKMATKGHLADIVETVMAASAQQPEPPPAADFELPPLSIVPPLPYEPPPANPELTEEERARQHEETQKLLAPFKDKLQKQQLRGGA